MLAYLQGGEAAVAQARQARRGFDEPPQTPLLAELRAVTPSPSKDHSWLDIMTMRSAHGALRIRLLVLRSLREQPQCSAI